MWQTEGQAIKIVLTDDKIQNSIRQLADKIQNSAMKGAKRGTKN